MRSRRLAGISAERKLDEIITDSGMKRCGRFWGTEEEGSMSAASGRGCMVAGNWRLRGKMASGWKKSVMAIGLWKSKTLNSDT